MGDDEANEQLLPADLTPVEREQPPSSGPVHKVFRHYDPNQDFLIPPSLDDWLAKEHLARFVAELVDEGLDLEPFLAAYKEPRGYPPYDPRLMLKARQLKEALRDLYRLADPTEAGAHLDWWLAWAQRSRIPAFVSLQKTVRQSRERILAAVELGLSNSKLEDLNSKIRLINHRGYGHRSLPALIAMICLCCGEITLTLPFEPSSGHDRTRVRPQKPEENPNYHGCVALSPGRKPGSSRSSARVADLGGDTPGVLSLRRSIRASSRC